MVRNRQKPSLFVSTMLLLSGLFLSVQRVHGRETDLSRPDNIEQLLNQFNKATGEVLTDFYAEDEEEQESGLKTLDKLKTQFDGVTVENQVTYLQLEKNQGVQLPVLSTGIIDSELDFTVMLWFKIEKKLEDQDIMYLFQFPDSVACYITGKLSILCDNQDRKKLQVESDEIVQGKWYHLTLMCSTVDSFLLVQNNNKVIARADITYFDFLQTQFYRWNVCLGDCNGDFGFQGGIRELVLMNRVITQEDAVKAKNMQFTYDSSFKAYYRFQNLGNKFNKDEFVDREWNLFKNEPETREQYIGVDIIPNDVCPINMDTESLLKFNNETQIATQKISKQLDQKSFEYTFSMTVRVDETVCVTISPTEAQEDCNLVLLSDVFMLYFEMENMAKFHFFASKNYYESQSKAFFIPFDQFVTIQMSMNRWDGYTIVVGDQNGKVFYSTSSDKNFYEQSVTGKLTVLKAFEGIVEHFALTNTYVSLSTDHVIDFRDRLDFLFNVKFDEQSILLDDVAILNSGTEVELSFAEGSKVEFQETFFQVPAAGLVGGTFKAESLFDGIACNDRHMTTKLASGSSYIRFNTPELTQWQDQNTFELWFKLDDAEYYDYDNLHILSIYDQDLEFPFLQIYIDGGDLICAPFGLVNERDAVLRFSDFKNSNEDLQGWWHISCSYEFQKRAKGVLYNSIIEQIAEQSLSGLPKYYPKDSLRVSIGASEVENSSVPELLVKEFRYWGKFMTQAEIANYRYSQIDPTLIDQSQSLISYFRLGTGTRMISNFVKDSPFSPGFEEVDVQLNDITFAEDFVEQEQFTYEKEIASVISQLVRTYHTVCPVYTYFLDSYCYSQPVNKVHLGVFPIWDEVSSTMSWDLSLSYSSVINQDMFQFLSKTWQTDDVILQDYFEQSQEQSLQNIVPASNFRHGAQYHIQVSLTNDQTTFFSDDEIFFIPNKCKWVQFADGSVQSGYQTIKASPGNDDIVFEMEVFKNPELDCTNFDFFDSLSAIEYELILTDSADYISIKPELTFEATYDNGLRTYDFDGTMPTPDNLKIKATLETQQQQNLPIFQDIKIMFDLKWSSSKFPDKKSLSDNLTFQNLIYQLKFEPLANQLEANFVSNLNQLIREEVLILDASNSFISNMPLAQQKKVLGYIWECEEIFKPLCQTKNGNQIQFTFEEVSTLQDFEFEKPYEFSVQIVWTKADENQQSDTLSQTITWYDVAKPSFEITYDSQPSPILFTAKDDTIFIIDALNFDEEDIRDYVVTWSLTPELPDPLKRQILSYGKLMMIEKGSYARNTEYTVSLTLTNTKLEKATNTEEFTFKIQSPPTPGSVRIDPTIGKIGDTFTVNLQDWVSDNLPITYDVFNTFDASGERKGVQINTDGPVPIEESFAFTITRTNPIMVVVQDESGESLEYILAPDIGVEVSDFTDVEEEEESTTEPDDQDAEDQDPESTVIEDEDEADEAVEDTDPLNNNQLFRSPIKMIEIIKSTDELNEKVNYMNSAVSQSMTDPDLLDDSERSERLQEHIEFRNSLLEVIEQEVREYKAEENNLYLSSRDFLVETAQMIVDLTSYPEYMDQDVADKASQVIYQLTNMEDDLFSFVLEADLGFRSNLFKALENINLFGRLFEDDSTVNWVKQQLSSFTDLICSFESFKVGDSYSFESDSDDQEIGLSLYKFDRDLALHSKRGQFKVLDAQYNYNTYNIYNSFSTAPGQICLQVFGINQGNMFIKKANIVQPYSQARVNVAFYESGSEYRYTPGQLMSHVNASFSVDPTLYKSNQTDCMAYNSLSKEWESSLCITELLVEDLTIKCSCNSFNTEHIGVFIDSTKELGETIVFPEPVEVEDESGATTIIYEIIEKDATEDLSESGPQSGFHNYMWGGQAVVTSILCIISLAITVRQDRADSIEVNVAKTAPILNVISKQNHFISEISKVLKEPYSSLMHRKQQIQQYRTFYTNSPFPHILCQLHPLFAPFITYYAHQSRFMRMSVFILQLNVLSIIFYAYYVRASRQTTEESTLLDEYLSSSDILTIIKISLIGSIVQLPILTEPITAYLSNQYATLEHNTVVVQTRRSCARVTVQILAVLTCLMIPVWAIVGSQNIPMKYQYSIAASVPISIVGGACFNFLYCMLVTYFGKRLLMTLNKGEKSESFGYSTCAVKFGCLLVPQKARQIILDMKAVQKIKDMFTLSDVLPSSLLEISQGDVHSRSLQEALGLSNVENNHPNDSQKDVEEKVEATIQDNEQVQERIDLVNERSCVSPMVHQNGILNRSSDDAAQIAEDDTKVKRESQFSQEGENENTSRFMFTGKMTDNFLKHSALDVSNVSRNDVLPVRTQDLVTVNLPGHSDKSSRNAQSISESSQFMSIHPAAERGVDLQSVEKNRDIITQKVEDL